MFQSAFEIDLDISPEWCAWFSGWLDGEGCFTVESKGNRGNALVPVLKVGLRDDDLLLLKQVRHILNCGRVSSFSNESARILGKQSQDTVRWQVKVISENCHIIVPILDKYPLRSKKHRDYIIWRELVMRVYQDEHLNSGRLRCLELVRQLSEVKKYKK